MSEASTGRPAGNPSTMTTRARPWDSPAVRKRSTQPRYRTANAVPGPRGPFVSTVEGVVPTAVIGHIGHALQLGHLFEQGGLDALAQRHLRHGATLATSGQTEVGRALLLVERHEVGAAAVAGDGG